ncbi:hypothetical protein [Nocardia callitridis]|uniref:PE domain-containing protein n=1 Tax=Nocardia callitridis TaxID=648753 RepID=A0ABP9KMZ7_9NOCA
MPKTTTVSTDHLLAVSGMMSGNHTAITALVSAAATAASPGRAALDDASALGATLFKAYTKVFLHGTETGLSNLLDGAEVLVPVSSDYRDIDIADGQAVRASGSF